MNSVVLGGKANAVEAESSDVGRAWFMAHDERVDNERGEAVAGFALTAGLTTLVFLIVMQFGYLLYTKAVIIDAAGQGARVAARHQGTMAQGIARTNALLDSVAGTPRVVATRHEDGAAQIIQISVSAQLPLLGPYGIPGLLNAKGNALVEEYEPMP